MQTQTVIASQLGKLAATNHNKQAGALSGALLGGGIGAARAPKGHRSEGLGRGATRGAMTGGGASIGALLGLLAGAGTHSVAGVDTRIAQGLAILGGLGGAGLGGYGGWRLSGGMLGKPSWEEDKDVAEDHTK